MWLSESGVQKAEGRVTSVPRARLVRSAPLVRGQKEERGEIPKRNEKRKKRVSSTLHNEGRVAQQVSQALKGENKSGKTGGGVSSRPVTNRLLTAWKKSTGGSSRREEPFGG